MIALVFLYMTGVIFILGAEINAALLKYRVRDLIARGSRERESEPATDP